MFHIRPVSRLTNHFSLKELCMTTPMRTISTSQTCRLRESENFTFNWDKVNTTIEKEREHFIKHKETFKIDQDEVRHVPHQRRKYTVSQDPKEWSYVERLIDQSKPKSIPVPQVAPGQETPSGFKMPTAKPGDYPYHVRRATSWMLPVYVSQPWRDGQPSATITTIRKVEGDVDALRKDLCKFLFDRYEQEFISQPNEFMQKVVFRGNFDADFKEFLKMKGF